MKRVSVSERFTISDQLVPNDIKSLAESGVQIIVSNRPNGEAADQTSYEVIEKAARACGVTTHYLPFKQGELTLEQIQAFAEIIESGKQVHAYCRTGNRSFSIFAAARASAGTPRGEILSMSKTVGFDVTDVIRPYYENSTSNDQEKNRMNSTAKPSFDIAIVGAGTGGIAAAASLLKRRADLRIALIDPSSEHFYQPGWTMVGGGVFSAESTKRQTKNLIPNGVSWLKHSVTGFSPEASEIQLDDGQIIHYEQLIVAPGLVIDWAGIKGLDTAIGKNGVTSNYSYKFAPYTWELVQGLKSGRAIFTQPPMPIKCAGAPQKALYLSADFWRKAGVLNNIDIDFRNAGGVLFGVNAYVPALQEYIEKYGVNSQFNQNLIEIDGENKVASFKNTGAEAGEEIVTQEFDMIHVCPPQRAPAFIADSQLSDAAGWLDVDQYSLRHKQFANIWGLGDVMNTPNAKTMAAVRMQVPVVAQNIIDVMSGREIDKGYNGYGSCPLTVERGKIVLAEFGYGGKLLPSFPNWIINGTKPTRMAWILKSNILPKIYWHGMLKGHEWLVAPKKLSNVKA